MKQLKPPFNVRNFILRGERNIANKTTSILKNINLHLKTGDRVGFLGKNGSGKTSLMRAILQTYPAISGTIKTNGTFLPIMDLGAGCAMELSGRYNVKLLFLYNGNIDQYNKDIEEEIIRFSGIPKDKIETPMKLYSMGMKARLVFSATVFQKGSILLMDEVFATGDKEFIKKSYEYMMKKWKEVDIGITISHNIDEIKKLCDYCYVMSSGEIINQGKTLDMIEFYENL